MSGAGVPRLLWPSSWREGVAEVGWLVVAGVLTPVAVVLVLAGLVLGVALTPVLAGTIVLAGVLGGARLLGGAHRRLADALLRQRLPRPPARQVRPGLWRWLVAWLTDPHSWRAVAYLLLRLPFGLCGLLLTTLLGIFGGAAASYPVTWLFTQQQELPVFGIHSQTWAGTLLWAVAGIAALVVWPAFTHAVVSVDRLLVRLLLADPGLRERVRILEETRATALEDAAGQLRRIERDLHDGAQAQLVAMAMKLGLAKEELATDEIDLPQVRALVSDAHGNAKRALVELRDLARGIHPPALDDGLGVALSTLATSGGLAATVSVELTRRPSPSLETVVYFAAAELMTNAAKHAGAPCAVRVSDDKGGLRLTVTDEGTGGAAVVPGGGLAGIAERLRPVDGELSVHSPPGGPTVVTAEVPVAR
ncbi:sensor histidine kinase [Amycolatopsis jiangsuensis]|uniref:histidine kinase n=1 Tax=Amycolatopsis jiangsuensis TaxID=1181879 RepID=A0A840IWD3_9PSEU|nr:sensor histidine kinase [Amycolatopsis jiangsuensis]MBB4685224.1 signal transduction histidine kinase [Amycolatopsis jiangsuensis]